jgi:nucleoside-diphosphate-sugar epimerase
MKLIVTGAKGRIGARVIAYARQHGIDAFGVDNVGTGARGSSYLSADLTDLGNCYAALHGGDAVINLAAIPDSEMFPSGQTFMTNTAITYNVYLAAMHLGIKRVIFASSVQVNHTVSKPIHYRYFPIDEEHPVDPQSDYALSKYVGEVIGANFAKVYGMQCVSLRFTDVVTQERWAGYPRETPPEWGMPLPHYVHIDDCARACVLAATADLPPASHTVAFITAQDTSLKLPSLEVAKRYYPDAEIRGQLPGFASMMSGERAKQAFGFVAEYSCRDAR